MLFRLGPGFWIETSCFILARGSILLQAVKCQSRLGVYKTPHVSFVKGGITTVERRERSGIKTKSNYSQREIDRERERERERERNSEGD